MPGSSMQGKLRRLSRGIARVEDVWYGRGTGNIMVRAALWPLSRAYDLAVSARTRLYDAGVLDTKPSALPTISVGNLTVGGTGKTPFSAWLASELRRRAKPAIALRGYGGDEGDVHRRLNPGIPVIENANRAAAVRDAKEQGADLVILDDAFQHRRIARNADVVLLSAEQLLRPRRTLPAGPWREKLPAAARADLLVVTRKSASPADAARAVDEVREAIPNVPIAVVHLMPARLENLSDTETMPLERLRGTPVLAIAAIGEPDLFKLQLQELGARVTLEAFEDHHAFAPREISKAAARVTPDGLAVCTLKDAVKLAGRWPGPSRLWYVSQQLVVEQGATELDGLLKRVLDARATAVTPAG